MTDDIIRDGLDRKTRVDQMKHRNTINERQSMDRVEKSRSPRRASASRSPLRPQSQNTGGGGNTLTQAYISQYNKQQS